MIGLLPALALLAGSSGPFDYDASRALDVREAGVEAVAGVAVHDLSYAGPQGRVTAYLVKPSGQGPFPAILYVHWGQGNRSEFLSEAVMMARLGAIGLLIDAPFAREDAPREADFAHPDKQRDMWVQGLVEMRRGIDLLVARRDVDPKRLGYVGHSYGATLGGTLAGVERRVKAYVLMGGLPSLADFDDPLMGAFFRGTTDEQRKKYAEAMEPIAAVHFLGQAPPAAVLLQFARHDRFISPRAADKLERAASEPKQTRWYFDSHEFADPEALRDRLQWLCSQLGLPDPRPLLREKVAGPSARP